MFTKKACPICDSRSIFRFLNHEKIPVHQNFLINDQVAAINITRGDLNLVVCNECGFIFNQTFDLSKLSYGDKYDNTQDCSSYFNSYLSKLANTLVFDKNIQNCTIVEIGCGKGSFLRKLVEIKEWGNTGYGFDPSYVGLETDLGGRLNFKKRYYDLDCTNINADVIVCRHVIEHVPDPLNLLRIIRKALNNSRHAHIFFETPSVEWILHNQVIYDFFYEHCSYFSASSLRTAFDAAGFKVESIKSVFEDQYLWLEAIPSTEKFYVTKNPASIPVLANQFAAIEQDLKKKWEVKIRELATRGKVAIWGAGAKGVTFANIFDPQRKWIDCVIDLNPMKHGKFIPGSGHPIINYKQIASR